MSNLPRHEQDDPFITGQGREVHVCSPLLKVGNINEHEFQERQICVGMATRKYLLFLTVKKCNGLKL